MPKSSRKGARNCPSNKYYRKSYTSSSGSRVKSTCTKKPGPKSSSSRKSSRSSSSRSSRCGPNKYYRKSYTNSNGKVIKATCVKKPVKSVARKPSKVTKNRIDALKKASKDKSKLDKK